MTETSDQGTSGAGPHIQGGPNTPGPQTPAETPVAGRRDADPPQPATPEREDPEPEQVPPEANKDFPQNRYGTAAPQDPPPAKRE
jgi:hypothetical protein